jgi:hypothetical protein
VERPQRHQHPAAHPPRCSGQPWRILGKWFFTKFLAI